MDYGFEFEKFILNLQIVPCSMFNWITQSIYLNYEI